MKCPYCLHEKSDIYNTRKTQKGFAVWRRRRCLQCNQVFTTQESTDPSAIWKVTKKTNKKPVRYNRAQLAMSILRVCDHRLQHDAETWYLFEEAERQLSPVAVANNQTITTDQIFETVCIILKRFDPAAYIKYISYHQPIVDARSLRKHLRKN